MAKNTEEENNNLAGENRTERSSEPAGRNESSRSLSNSEPQNRTSSRGETDEAQSSSENPLKRRVEEPAEIEENNPTDSGEASGSDVEPYDRLQRHNRSSDAPQSEQRPLSPAPDEQKREIEPYGDSGSGTDGKSGEKDSKQKNSTGKEVAVPSNGDRPVRKPRGSAGGAIAAAGVSAAANTARKTKDSLQAKDTFGEEEETDDKPKKDKKGGLLAGGAKKAAGALAAKAGVALKGLLLSPKGLIVLLIAILIPIVLIAVVIVGKTAERTISHTKKYGCVEDKFTADFLEKLSPGNGETIGSQIGDLFSDTESSCTDGSGWTGEFYPPTIGYISSYWYYDAPANTMFHGATDIAAYEGAPIFAYAGGEVISRVDGTANAVGDPGSCDRSTFAPWSYAMTVQGDLRISHQPGILETRYAHMWKKDMIARVGDIVSAGDQIAGQGNTGWSCGNHLHFEIYENGQRVDPYYHMKERGINYPISLEELPPKPEGKGGGSGDGENSENVDKTLMGYAAKMMSDNGITPSSSEKTCLAKLWNRESGWNVSAENPSSGAYGIPQSLPGNKMASEGSDWRTNPQTQIRWGIKYIKNRYGTPCDAWAHSELKNWY